MKLPLHATVFAILSLTTLAKPLKQQKGMDPLMTLPGKTLLEEKFIERSWIENWKPYSGEFEIRDKALRMAALPSKGHPPEASVHLPMEDVIIRFRFRFDGANLIGIQVSNDKAKHHLFNLSITPGGVALKRVTGWGPTTKFETLDKAELKLDPGDWHEAVIEVRGKEICARIGEDLVLLGESDGLEADKPRLSLIAGGRFAWFDDVTIQSARPNPDWEKEKPRIESARKRRLR